MARGGRWRAARRGREAGLAAKLNVITGATGLLGSHIAEQLAARGERVRALVRPSSDTTFLRGLGAELVPGDLTDPASLPAAVAGADVVYHCAARVGEWGPWAAYQAQILDATRNLLDACRAAGVGRVLHVSSITVYGHPRLHEDRRITEDEPLGQHLWRWGDYYCRAKIGAEELCRQYPGPLTIIRPSWIHGPRDRTTLPRVFAALESGRVALIGRGDNLLNIVYAADVADGAIRAANHPGAVGRAYNLSSEGEITQRQLVDWLTDALGRPRVRMRWPYRVAFWGGFAAELIGRAIRLRRPPHFTRYAVTLVGRPTRFSIERARTELGWAPRVPAAEGLRRSLDWYYGRNAAPGRAPVPPLHAGETGRG
jgi:nucleoside-diphosphate-sugar epimerase